MRYLKESARPLLAEEVVALKVVDRLEDQEGGFLAGAVRFAEQLATDRRKLKVAILRRNEKRKMLFKFATLEDYESAELTEMRADIFEDRNGFANKRRKFVTKQ